MSGSIIDGGLGRTDLERVASFAVVAEELHFGRAAKRLGISESALSKRIRGLERDLCVRLFERTTVSVRLTPAGAALVEPAQRAIDGVRTFLATADAVAAGRTGPVRVLYAPGVGPLLVQLLRAVKLPGGLPDLQVDMHQMISADAIRSVVAGDAPLAMVRLPPRAPTIESLTVQRRPHDVVVVPADHRLASCQAVDAADLAAETVVVAAPESIGGTDIYRDLGYDRVFTRVRYVPVMTEDELFDSVAAGLGVLMTCRQVAQQYTHHQVVAVGYVGQPSPQPQEIRLIWRRGDDTPAVAAIIQAARATTDVTEG